MRNVYLLSVFFILFNSYFLLAQWEKCKGSIEEKFVEGLASDSNYLYAVSLHSGFHFSTDNGANWNSSNKGLFNLNTWDIGVLNNKIFIGTDSGLFVSTDKGMNWFTDTLKFPKSFINFIGIDKNNIYAISEKMYFSSDNGVNWEIFNKIPIPVYSIDIIDDSIYISGYNNVYLSIDKGQNWKEIFNFPDQSIFIYIFDNKLYLSDDGMIIISYDRINLIYTSWPKGMEFMDKIGENIFLGGLDNAGIVYSHDNGYSWAKMNNGLSDLRIVGLKHFGHYLFAFTESGPYRLDLNTVGVHDKQNNSDITFSISPNPAPDFIEISCLGTQTFVSQPDDIRIFNTLGELVISVVARCAVPLRIDVSELPAGIYIIKIGDKVSKFVKY